MCKLSKCCEILQKHIWLPRQNATREKSIALDIKTTLLTYERSAAMCGALTSWSSAKRRFLLPGSIAAAQRTGANVWSLRCGLISTPLWSPHRRNR